MSGSNQETSDLYSDIHQEDIFEYLSDLRRSGVTNMLGAAPYLVKEYDVTIDSARKMLSDWMENGDHS